MDIFVGVCLSIALVVFSHWLTERFRRFAIRRELLDIPNARSSHRVVTPRGGGVAIVLPTLVTTLALGLTRWLAWPLVCSICIGGALVALIGFLDDRENLAPRWRLLGHFAAASLVLVTLGGVPPLSGLGVVLDQGWVGFACTLLYIVWLLNLTNFMDGIDGLAGVETVTVCLIAAILTGVYAPGEHLWAAPVVLASSSLGFLVWNWPPAKIFMGDVGSGFLGLMLAVLSLQAGWATNGLFWSWVILLGVFVVDATVTLVRRIAQGERFYEAHRSHAYQHAAQRLGGHQFVSVTVALINLFWLSPIAFVVASGRLHGPVGVLIAYAPLVVTAVRLRAGRPFMARPAV